MNRNADLKSPIDGQVGAAGELFGRIASLAALVVDMVECRGGGNADGTLDAVGVIAARMGAIADTAAAICGEVQVLGDVSEWCFDPCAANALSILRGTNPGAEAESSQLANGGAA